MVLGQADHVALHALHRVLQVGLPLLHPLLVVLHRLHHVYQLVQQRHHRYCAHLSAVHRAPRGDRARAGWHFKAEPGEGTGRGPGRRGRGGRGGRRAEARDKELRVLGLLAALGLGAALGLRDGVGAARGAAAGLGVGRFFFHGSRVVVCPAVTACLRGTRESFADSRMLLLLLPLVATGERCKLIPALFSASTPLCLFLSAPHTRTNTP